MTTRSTTAPRSIGAISTAPSPPGSASAPWRLSASARVILSFRSIRGRRKRTSRSLPTRSRRCPSSSRGRAKRAIADRGEGCSAKRGTSAAFCSSRENSVQGWIAFAQLSSSTALVHFATWAASRTKRRRRSSALGDLTIIPCRMCARMLTLTLHSGSAARPISSAEHSSVVSCVTGS